MDTNKLLKLLIATNLVTLLFAGASAYYAMEAKDSADWAYSAADDASNYASSASRYARSASDYASNVEDLLNSR